MLNICFCVDRKECKHIYNIIKSIITNSNNTDKIKFYVLVDDDTTLSIIQKRLVSLNIIISYSILTDQQKKFITDNMRIHVLENGGKYIECIMNFARFYITEHFEFETCLYLDIDMIVQTDIYNLYTECDLKVCPLWATPMDRTNYDIPYLHDRVSPDYKFFITGLYYFDCKYWKENQLTKRCEEIMISHKSSKKPLFTLGTQPIINIIMANKYGMLDKRWNVHGLGGNPRIPADVLKSAYVLHWNGRLKPWYKVAFYRNLWTKWSLNK